MTSFIYQSFIKDGFVKRLIIYAILTLILSYPNFKKINPHDLFVRVELKISLNVKVDTDREVLRKNSKGNFTPLTSVKQSNDNQIFIGLTGAALRELNIPGVKSVQVSTPKSNLKIHHKVKGSIISFRNEESLLAKLTGLPNIDFLQFFERNSYFFLFLPIFYFSVIAFFSEVLFVRNKVGFNMQWLSFYYVIALVLLSVGVFLFLSDLAPVLFSDYPFLYGVLNINHVSFEQSILYLPILNKISLSNFFALDHFGAALEKGLAPLPYFSFLVLWIIKTLSFGSVNTSIVLTHLLVLVEFYFLFQLLNRFFIKNFYIACLIALLIIWDWSTDYGSILIFGLFLSGVRYFLPLKYFSPFYLIGSIIFLILQYHRQYLSMSYSFRFISPLIPFIIFFISLIMCLRTVELFKARTNTAKLPTMICTCILIGANFYTYYLNALFMIPMTLFVATSAVKLRSYSRKELIISLVILALLSTPFIVINLHNFWSAEFQQFVDRAAFRGIKGASSTDKPPFYWVDLRRLTLISVLLWLRLKSNYFKSDSVNVVIVLLGFSYFILWSNYLIPKLIPQPALVRRFQVVFELIGWGTLINFLVPQKYSFVVQNLILAKLLFIITIGVGILNYHEKISGPANTALFNELQFLQKHVNKKDILVSESQSINILIPGTIGARTLNPNPVMSVLDNWEIVEQYILMFRLQNKKADELIKFLLTAGHERNLQDENLWSQTKGPTYIFPHIWVKQNEESIREKFQIVELNELLKKYEGTVYLHVKTETELSKEFCWRKVRTSESFSLFQLTSFADGCS